ncbi:MAG: bifunctional 4-hydroxy-3-methylbut-2-enyl diphosphate reductase/30S ribosomal protein S1 [Firmicutes bacterium]|nr:bifunctional 4-hydroxy-3-methylbut-2-enyl diphosphate reductase/30S ribosomal protein S1 [Bacillota bacterium]
MKVRFADDLGFCYGVKRAVEMAEAAAGSSGGTIYCLGPLIHNPQEVERLRSKGIRPVEGLAQVIAGTLVLRTHGMPRDVVAEALRRGLPVVDATCPHVRAAQQAAKSLSEQGYRVLIVGDPEHPEVIATSSWAGNGCAVIDSVEKAQALPATDRAGVVAQTTVRRELFEAVVEVLRGRVPDLKVEETICEATARRQEATRRLAGCCDLLLVVGGRGSANTRRLAEIAREEGCETHLIESAEELRREWFMGKSSVGMTAGTSTPEWVIKEVAGKVEDIEKNVSHEEAPQASEPEQKAGGQPEAAAAPETLASPEPEVKAEAEAVPEAPAPEPPSPEQPAAQAGPAEGQMYDEALKVVKSGDLIKGKVVSVDENGVMVDVGYKSEGVIPPNEVSRKQAPLTEIVHPGDEIMVYVLSVDSQEGVLKLSKRRADEEVAWKSLQEALDEGRIIEAEVIQEVKGGLVVDVGLRGFVPASQIERGYVSNLSRYVGKQVRLKVLELDRSKNRVVLSQRVVLEEERERLRTETWSSISEGQVRRGVVKGLTDFGAFVDIGGVDGLLHVSELSWGRVSHPSEVVKEGDQIDVMVLRIDREKGKISLGLKQVLPDPWSTVSTKYPVDAVVQGKVTRLAPFGAFVQLEPGVEGLIHISEMSHQRVAKPDEVLSPGQAVKVKVLKSKPDERRISLSLKAVEDDTEKARADEYIAEQKALDNPTLGDMFGDILGEARGDKETKEDTGE